MAKTSQKSTGALWAGFRFSVVGQLLALSLCGGLKTAIRALAEKTWRHPVTDCEVQFAASPSNAGTTRRDANAMIPSVSCAAPCVKIAARCRSPRRSARGREMPVREICSYEADYVGSLWHFDFHDASLKVFMSSGQWMYPIALGILDDHSRLCCHVQWYLSETAEDLVHGLSQAIQRGVCHENCLPTTAPRWWPKKSPKASCGWGSSTSGHSL